MKRVAVVVGSGGQDGTLLTELLDGLDYEVIGLRRGDLDTGDHWVVADFVARHKPAEIYYLAAYHHSSEDIPDGEGELFHQSMRTHFDDPVNFLDAISIHSPSSRFFYAASSHVFGAQGEGLQNEETPFQPESAYAISKVAGMMACRYYRKNKGVFASVGILYNHESPLRSKKFVTRKIVSAAARIAREGQGNIVLGDLAARIDWGYAPDYVDAMHRILSIEQPGNYVVATGEAHAVGEFAEIAFRSVGLDYQNHVSTKQKILLRQNPSRVGDASRLRRETGWKPTVSFEEMVNRLVVAEIKARDELLE